MPTTSMRLPLTKIAIVKAQNAGLKTSPICSLVIWNVWLSGPAMSPRIANTTEAVAIDRQLATNNLCVCIDTSRGRRAAGPLIAPAIGRPVRRGPRRVGDSSRFHIAHPDPTS